MKSTKISRHVAILLLRRQLLGLAGHHVITHSTVHLQALPLTSPRLPPKLSCLPCHKAPVSELPWRGFAMLLQRAWPSPPKRPAGEREALGTLLACWPAAGTGASLEQQHVLGLQPIAALVLPHGPPSSLLPTALCPSSRSLLDVVEALNLCCPSWHGLNISPLLPLFFSSFHDFPSNNSIRPQLPTIA